MDPVTQALTVCGLSAAQIQAVKTEGYIALDDFRHITTKQVQTMLGRVTALAGNRGGVRFGQAHITKVQALAYWVRDKHRRDLVSDPDYWDADELDDALINMEIETAEKDAETDLKPPAKFKPSEWVDFEVKMENYLGSLRGVRGVPLSYVIRDDDDPEMIEDELQWQEALDGPSFKADAKTVFMILKDCLVGTDGHEWVKSVEKHKNGRLTMAALKEH